MSSASEKFGRDHGLIHEVVVTGRKAGWGAEEWAKLAHDEETMRQIAQVLKGRATINTIDHIIDLDADPFNPSEIDWTVEEHQKGGQWKFDPKEVEFFLSEAQKGGRHVEGHKLREELQKKRVMNANVLDYLLKHPNLIPDDWKRDEQDRARYIFFWGTVYRSRDGRLYVRDLVWGGVGWHWHCRWLGYGWDDGNPAAVHAS